MEYPGNRQLSSQAQERVLTAFRQAVQKLQEGGREEAMIALEFVLRLDPKFGPAQHLHQQLTSGASEIDLSSIVGQLQDPASTEVDRLLVDAVDDFNERRFHQAKEKVDRVLLELPGHKEGRDLLRQIEEALKVEAQVGQYLVQARQALDRDDPEESANFVMMAQALDPHHPGIATVLAELQERGVSAPPPEPPAVDTTDADPEPGEFAFGFETSELSVDAAEPSSPFDTAFDQGPSVGDAREPGLTTDDAVAGDVDDLFDSGDESAAAAPSPETPPESADSVRDLLIQGEEAFQHGDLDTAIDTWSRVFLVDATNTEAIHLIEQARKRRAETRHEVESLLSEALEAARNGRAADAARLLNDLLKLEPTNLAAIELADQLETGDVAAAPAPEAQPAPEPEEPAAPDVLDDLGVDLFDAEEAPDAAAGAPAGAPAGDLADVLDSIQNEVSVTDMGAPAAKTRAGRGLPIRPIAMGVGALLVLALGIWFGLSFLGGGEEEGVGQEALQRTLVEAQKLYKEGRAREAVHLLENLDATGPDRARVERRLEKYRQALLPPTPTPVPDEAVAAREALAAGRWLEAYRLVQDGLERHPEDPGLMELREEILQVDSAVVPLLKAESDGDYETAVGICRDLLERHPDNPEIQQELGRNLFNLAVTQLRAYNLTGAEVNLAELATMNPDDDDVQRILEFVARYKVRPVDMQLRIFISSLKLR